VTEPRAPVRASAPVRLDLAGGWTDVAPFVEREGGAVVNVAIDLRTEVEFVPGGEGWTLRADDVGESLRVRNAEELDGPGALMLHRAALRMLPVGPGLIRSRAGAPAGSGLGSSGALDVALVAALCAARGERPGSAEIARRGAELEIREAGLAGGRQDQYAAALGGVQSLVFRGATVVPGRVAVDPEFLVELERRTVICYTGQSRISGETIRRVMAAYEAGDDGVTGALLELLALAGLMVGALLAADLTAVARLLSANWACQQRLDAGMCTPEMRALESAMRGAGALGGKAAGAGAGGSMFFIMGGDPELGAQAAEAHGARVLRARWGAEGVTVC